MNNWSCVLLFSLLKERCVFPFVSPRNSRRPPVDQTSANYYICHIIAITIWQKQPKNRHFTSNFYMTKVTVTKLRNSLDKSLDRRYICSCSTKRNNGNENKEVAAAEVNKPKRPISLMNVPFSKGFRWEFPLVIAWSIGRAGMKTSGSKCGEVLSYESQRWLYRTRQAGESLPYVCYAAVG